MKRKNSLIALAILLISFNALIMPASAEDLFASFSASQTKGYVPFTVYFYDQSSGNPTSWKWNFGDGSPLYYGYNPTHTYTKPGVYTITETVSNTIDKDTTIRTNYITVYAYESQPTADFYASPTSGKTPSTVKFYDRSKGSPNTWKWSFGDGSSLYYGYNPTHTYTKPGVYTVKETVSNSIGKDTEIKTNYITVSGSTPKNTVSISALYVGAAGQKPYQEYVKITNSGTTAVSMKSWKIRESKNTHTYYFPSAYVLKAKSTVTLRSGSGTNSASILYWNKYSFIWDNNGDTAYLYDAQGKLVSSKKG